ncbi:MAG: filamentous hemagglutinin N-terminal domain-containing protein, partial [Leptolyngbyaceae cyanobacterium]
MVVSPFHQWCQLGLLGLCLSSGVAQAQSITPAADGVGTQVQQLGDTYVIDGGTTIEANLFHSFQQLGLTPGEIAHFLATPTIQNVVGRVVGGDPSVIQGLIRLTGSDANLYLLNPAGWVLTDGAQLDVPGSFGLTTGDRIGFDDSFFGIGTTDLAGGPPTSLVFDSASPGTIINGADLTVPAGESLWLVGGTVISTGRLHSAGGTITLAAVPGESQVILSHEALAVELVLDGVPLAENPQSINGLDAVALAQTLGGTDALATVTGVTVAADGTVWLTDAAPATVGTTLVSGQLSVTGPEAGVIDIFGQTVGLLSADLQADGAQGGGMVRIGGDYRGQGAPTATYTVVDAASQISANALQQGDGGRVIVWADNTTRFLGAIAARGGPLGGNGGFVEVSGAVTLGFDGQVDTTAVAGTVGTLLLDPTDISIVAGALSPPSAADGLWAFGEDAGAQTIGADTVVALLGTAALTLQATNTISVNSAIASPTAFDLTLEANNNIVINADITTAGGDVTLIADADGLNGGAVTLTGTTISTGSGAIALTGTGADGATGTDGGDGITLTNSSLVTTSGALALTGTGGTGGTGSNGQGGGQGAGTQVAGINGSNGQAGTNGPPVVASLGGGTGSAGGAGGSGGNGIVLNNSALTAETGLITLTGTGGTGGAGGVGGGGGGGVSNYYSFVPGGIGGSGGVAGGDGAANGGATNAAGGTIGANALRRYGPTSSGAGHSSCARKGGTGDQIKG